MADSDLPSARECHCARPGGLHLRGRDVVDVAHALQIYPGEPHAFIADWLLSIRRTDRFLDQHL